MTQLEKELLEACKLALPYIEKKEIELQLIWAKRHGYKKVSGGFDSKEGSLLRAAIAKAEKI